MRKHQLIQKINYLELREYILYYYANNYKDKTVISQCVTKVYVIELNYNRRFEKCAQVDHKYLLNSKVIDSIICFIHMGN